MIAGETISILEDQNDYDAFFRRRRKRRKKRRTKAERKAKRRKFWQGVGNTIKGIGGFQGVGSTLDSVTGMNQKPPMGIATPPISTTDTSGISFQVGGGNTSDNVADKKINKSNKGMFIAIGGVLLLIMVIGGSLYMQKRAMDQEALIPV